MLHLSKALDLTLLLTRIAEASGIPLESTRLVLIELASLPVAERDALLAEAHRSRIRELSAEVRRRPRGAR